MCKSMNALFCPFMDKEQESSINMVHRHHNQGYGNPHYDSSLFKDDIHISALCGGTSAHGDSHQSPYVKYRYRIHEECICTGNAGGADDDMCGNLWCLSSKCF